MGFAENCLGFFLAVGDETALEGLFEPEEVAVSLVVGQFQPGNDCETFNVREGCSLDWLIVVGDGYEIQPVEAGMLCKVLQRQNAVRCQGMDVQITAEPAGRFRRECDAYLDVNSFRGDDICAEDDLPVSWCEWMRLVARR